MNLHDPHSNLRREAAAKYDNLSKLPSEEAATSGDYTTDGAIVHVCGQGQTYWVLTRDEAESVFSPIEDHIFPKGDRFEVVTVTGRNGEDIHFYITLV